ncbi:snapalysin family zinc-dependent metalloprotease [Rhizohabitans arisaemae]|uniref:snapalysin family zinc-dependent metalloprotease n=1 Tax=Rhizohabitans arisaemae TaxID=2720610 RepID=UPI0024B08162|nr:snapalysin family zinc-dependent metalloprotease [Rhizohabitans arisaemae]
MRTRSVLRTAATAALGLSLLVGTGAAASPASASSGAVRVLKYNSSQAGEFRSVIAQAVQIWNSSVTNVQIVAGSPADITFYVDNGWPRAMPTSLGRGRIWMGRQATGQGHNALRIGTHEIGHILGMPDRRTGLCSQLMSGSSAGTSCTNPNPNAAEIAEVNRYFAGQVAPSIEYNKEYVNR